MASQAFMITLLVALVATGYLLGLLYLVGSQMGESQVKRSTDKVSETWKREAA